ncbi:uncharacterized protein FFB20_15905 [Fusarium fujikuroi]|nr:uncharacterized protein FFB20_15905 [Fusarium fujikuroi]
MPISRPLWPLVPSLATLMDLKVIQDLHYFYNIKYIFINLSALRYKKCNKLL